MAEAPKVYPPYEPLMPILARLRRAAERNPDGVRKLLAANPKIVNHIRILERNPVLLYQPWDLKEEGRLPDGNIKSSPLRFHRDKSKIRVIVTGNRCGKTYTGADEVIAACIGIDPVTKRPSRRFTPPLSVWVISDTEGSSIEIAQKIYNDLMPQDWLADKALYSEKNGWRGNFVPFRNGSGIRFHYSAQGRGALQGTYQHIIHIDEEQPEDIWTECVARTTPVGGRPRGEIILTFTPIFNPTVGISWVHSKLYARRNDIPSLAFHFWTLYDVPDWIVPDEEKASIVANYDEDEREVRVYGMFTPVGMTLAFPRDLIAEQREHAAVFVEGEIEVNVREELVPAKDITFLPEGVAAPTTTATHEVLSFVPEDGAAFRVRQRPDGTLALPIPGHRYVIGGDPAQGRVVSKDADEQAFYVLDRDTAPVEVVAEWTGKVDPHEWAAAMHRSGRWYNWAYIGVENNADVTAIEYLRVNDYPNLHFQCVIEGRVYDRQTDKLGWNTSAITRRKLRNDALRMLRNGELRVFSERLIGQWESFARNGQGRWEAIRGAHDDRVFAWMIAVQMVEYAGLVDDWREEGLLERGPETDANRIVNARWSAPDVEPEPGTLQDRFDRHMERKGRQERRFGGMNLVGE